VRRPVGRRYAAVAARHLLTTSLPEKRRLRALRRESRNPGRRGSNLVFRHGRPRRDGPYPEVACPAPSVMVDPLNDAVAGSNPEWIDLNHGCFQLLQAKKPPAYLWKI
jgi:hypothetical protein